MTSVPSTESICEQLAIDVARHSAGKEWTGTAIQGLEFYRQNAPTACSVCIVEPSLALVVQGEKSMTLGEQVFHYNTSRFLITSLELPAKMQVLQASEEKPYLGIVLKLNLSVMSELMMQAPLSDAKASVNDVGMQLGETSVPLMSAFQRLIALLDEPESVSVLSPLVMREIYWRVLISEQGEKLRQVVQAGSHGLRISRSIEWIKANYDKHLSVEGLAELARMSKSTFHQHFRQLTSISPLQYQKRLRLMEARRLMMGENMDASSAAYTVGYESPSQFSREYSRLFGTSPKRDVTAVWQ